jgi:hypothetical protein
MAEDNPQVLTHTVKKLGELMDLINIAIPMKTKPEILLAATFTIMGDILKRVEYLEKAMEAIKLKIEKEPGEIDK